MSLLLSSLLCVNIHIQYPNKSFRAQSCMIRNQLNHAICVHQRIYLSFLTIERDELQNLLFQGQGTL
jgi:hypothetical protein